MIVVFGFFKICRLVSVEEELRKEQQRLQAALALKDRVIENQNQKIQSLHAANTRLHEALTQLKERYQLQARNGVSSKPLTLCDIGDFKSSTC